MAAWELSDLQRQAAAQRAEVARRQHRLDQLEVELALASAAEGHHLEQRDVLRTRMAAIRFAPRVTDADRAAYRQLEAELATLDAERARWVASTAVRWSDGILEHVEVLTVADVSIRRDRARVARDVAQARLSQLEAELSAGELVQTGVPADEYAAHRERLEALRARLG